MRALLRFLVGLATATLLSFVAVAAPFAFIPSGSAYSVTVIDTATNDVVATVNGPGSGDGVAVHPNGLRVYFTSNHAYNYIVSVFDTTTFTVAATIRVGESPRGIAVSSAGSRAYVANVNSNTISVIDTTTNTNAGTFSACSQPSGIAVNPTGTRLYVGCSDVAGPSASLGIVDAANGAAIANVTLGSSAVSPQGIAVNPAGTRVYVTVPGSNALAVIDTASNAIAASVPVGSRPRGVAVNPAGTRVYVTNELSNNVSVIDTETNTVISTVAVGGMPAGISVAPGGARVYVANEQSSDVSVIDTANNTVVARIAVGMAPVAIGQFIGGDSLPAPVPPVPGPALQVAAGANHTCAVVAGGGVKCWGDNRYGQLGDGTYVNRSRPVDVVGLSFPAAYVATGNLHTCAASTAGAVKCWGSNAYGQLGDGSSASYGDNTVRRNAPVDVAGLSSGVVAIAAGQDHTCALTTGGAVRCWGNNNAGQLGDGTSWSQGAAWAGPHSVSGLSGIVGVAVGWQVSAAVTGDGLVKAWGKVGAERRCQGDPWSGGYCYDVPVISRVPMDMPSLPGGIKAIAIAPTGYRACAFTAAGRVICWDVAPTGSPGEVGGLTAGVTAISMGGQTCVLDASGNALCWGANNYNQPTIVPGLPSGLTGISSGDNHACALTATGEVMCWGTNDYGEIGDGTTSNRSTAVTVIGPAWNYQGLWWASPAGTESGWGINFAHQGEVIFATWYTYDLAGRAWWLTMTAYQGAERTFSGTLYQATGPPFNATAFNPSVVTRTAVGSGTLNFSDANNATFAYTVNGISQTKVITRQVFGPLPTCVWGMQANLALATNYQDLWWAAPAESESGWGVNLTHQGDIIFATWFTYDFDGGPLWLSATVHKSGAGIYGGTLYRTTGPAFNAVQWDPKAVTRTPTGTLTLTFANGNTASYAYTVALSATSPATQTKSITRQVFRTPGTLCQ